MVLCFILISIIFLPYPVQCASFSTLTCSLIFDHVVALYHGTEVAVRAGISISMSNAIGFSQVNVFADQVKAQSACNGYPSFMHTVK